MSKDAVKAQSRGSPRVVMVSDITWGGAAIACRRLYEGLNHLPLTVRWVAARSHGEEQVVDASEWPDLWSLFRLRLMKRLRLAPRRLQRAEWLLASRNINAAVRAARPVSVINLHNIHNAVPFDFVRRLSANIPIVWTLHDMWPLTGYCSHSCGCQKYAEGCRGSCPELGKWGMPVRSPGNEFRMRQAFFEQNRGSIVMVAQSRWMTECAQRRFGQQIRIEHIPLSVDGAVFRPVDRAAARTAIGIPHDRRVILTGAAALDDERKGSRHLAAAIERLPEPLRRRVLVVAFGARDARGRLPTEWRCVGRIHDERFLSLHYAAADWFAMPSLAESFGQVYIEAMAAGTPCVAYDVGGCTEAVRPGVTGLVAPVTSVECLADTLRMALDMPPGEYAAMCERCRRTVLDEYSPETQANRYARLFCELSAGGCRA